MIFTPIAQNFFAGAVVSSLDYGQITASKLPFRRAIWPHRLDRACNCLQPLATACNRIRPDARRSNGRTGGPGPELPNQNAHRKPHHHYIIIIRSRPAKTKNEDMHNVHIFRQTDGLLAFCLRASAAIGGHAKSLNNIILMISNSKTVSD